MDADANLIGEFIAEQLEKRIPFKGLPDKPFKKLNELMQKVSEFKFLDD